MPDNPQLLGLIARERIRQLEINRPDPAVIRAFMQFHDLAGLVARAMDRLGIVGAIPAHELTPLAPGRRIAGPAITARNVPARFAPYHALQHGAATQMGEREAYFCAREGDVIVIDGGGRMLSSNMGPNSATMAKAAGILGSIVDGPVTGVAGIGAADYPVWCRGGTTLTGHHRVETIEVNGVISCTGVQVAPGDLVLADDSGVSIIPQALILPVLETAQAMAEKGRALAQAVQLKNDPSEIREALRRVATEELNVP